MMWEWTQSTLLDRDISSFSRQWFDYNTVTARLNYTRTTEKNQQDSCSLTTRKICLNKILSDQDHSYTFVVMI